MKTPIGIDLGTTNSATAFVNDAGQTEMILNADGAVLTPSVVLFDEEETIIGSAAKLQAKLHPEKVAERAKRDIGHAYYSRPIHDKKLPPEVVQAFILKGLRGNIEQRFGEDYEAVVTVPAYFDEKRRAATAEAVELADINFIDIVNEPTAAALAYGERLGYLSCDGTPSKSLNVLVYDLGGGTFDVTVLSMEAGQFTIVATDGDFQLGGCDWDARISRHVWSEYKAQNPNAKLSTAATSKLSTVAEAAKETLSSRQSVDIRFEHDDCVVATKLSRQQFEEMTDDLLRRTEFTTQQALLQSGFVWDDISRILLVGGATRMPAVRQMIKQLSGMDADTTVNPDEAVARGAAVYAAQKLGSTELKIREVNSHSLGIEGINLETLRKENVRLIPKNTPIPTEVRRRFVTKKDGQRSVNIRVLEGESTIPDQCAALDAVCLKRLPPDLPAGTEIDVCYRYLKNGRLEVKAEIENAGEPASLQLKRHETSDRLGDWHQVVKHHGGFDEFSEMVGEILEEFDLAETYDEVPDAIPVTSAATFDLTAEPAVPLGAPVAAAEALQREDERLQQLPRASTSAPSRTKRRRSLRGLVFAVGHVTAAIVGLSLGYVILCKLRPDLNFLEVPLPWAEESVSQPNAAHLSEAASFQILVDEVSRTTVSAAEKTLASFGYSLLNEEHRRPVVRCSGLNYRVNGFAYFQQTLVSFELDYEVDGSPNPSSWKPIRLTSNGEVLYARTSD